MKKNKKKKDDTKIYPMKQYDANTMVMPDENGSYTGVTKDTALYGLPEEPVQDADDL